MKQVCQHISTSLWPGYCSPALGPKLRTRQEIIRIWLQLHNLMDMMHSWWPTQRKIVPPVIDILIVQCARDKNTKHQEEQANNMSRTLARNTVKSLFKTILRHTHALSCFMHQAIFLRNEKGLQRDFVRLLHVVRCTYLAARPHSSYQGSWGLRIQERCRGMY